MKHRAANGIKRRTVNIIGVACLVLATYFATASTVTPTPQEKPLPSEPAPESAMVVVGNLSEGNLYAALFTKPGGWVNEFVNQGTRKDGRHCLETEEPQWYCGPRNGYALRAYCQAEKTTSDGYPSRWFAVEAPDEFVYKNSTNMPLYRGVRLAYIDSEYIEQTSGAELLPNCDKLLASTTV